VSSAEATTLYPVPNAAELENVPDELRARRQWVLWKLKRRKDRSIGEVRWDKVPYTADGAPASHSDLMTWSSFEETTEALHAEGSGFRGVGFVFSSADPYSGIDLDRCRDPESGELEEWAARILAKLGGYAEVSPSGHGVHVIVRAEIPRSVKKSWIEVYSERRFFTMTGRAL
jgi:primase-polymerase (primpol)-like protein